jgi:hypothetical protein
MIHRCQVFPLEVGSENALLLNGFLAPVVTKEQPIRNPDPNQETHSLAFGVALQNMW